MTRVRNIVARWLAVLGWPGLAGAGLVAFAVLFHVFAIMPSSARLEQVRQEAGVARDALKKMAQHGIAGGNDQESRLAAFYRFFPAMTAAPDWLEKIYAAAARQSISLEQGEYKLLESRDERLAVLQVNLPLRGSDLQIRNFVAEVLNDVPVAALEDVSFQRQAIGDSAVEAKVRLTLYLRTN
jgi:Tfp pilus assembly protein PilO